MIYKMHVLFTAHGLDMKLEQSVNHKESKLTVASLIPRLFLPPWTPKEYNLIPSLASQTYAFWKWVWLVRLPCSQASTMHPV